MLSREIGFAAPASWRAASRYFHDRFGALIDLSPVAVRCYRKPLGYAGDFEMMNMLYRNQSLGDTLFGRSLSRFLLDSDAGQAVCHRAPYLVGKITAAAGRGGPDRPARILSVAAGPAMELQQILRTDPALLRTGRAEITLLDQDASALSHAREQIAAAAAQAGGLARKRHDQMPRRALLQRAHRIHHLGQHGQARSGHRRSQFPRWARQPSGRQ